MNYWIFYDFLSDIGKLGIAEQLFSSNKDTILMVIS